MSALVRAPDWQPARHDVTFVDKQLHVESLDLMGSPAHLLGQVERLAERMRLLQGGS